MDFYISANSSARRSRAIFMLLAASGIVFANHSARSEKINETSYWVGSPTTHHTITAPVNSHPTQRPAQHPVQHSNRRTTPSPDHPKSSRTTTHTRLQAHETAHKSSHLPEHDPHPAISHAAAPRKSTQHSAELSTISAQPDPRIPATKYAPPAVVPTQAPTIASAPISYSEPHTANHYTFYKPVPTAPVDDAAPVIGVAPPPKLRPRNSAVAQPIQPTYAASSYAPTAIDNDASSEIPPPYSYPHYTPPHVESRYALESSDTEFNDANTGDIPRSLDTHRNFDLPSTITANQYPQHATSKFGRPTPLYGSREILLHQNEMADIEGLNRIRNDAELDQMRRQHLLLPLPVSSRLTVDPRLPANRRYCRPWTAKFLTDIAAAFYARFAEPLQVDSAVRTVAVQQHLERVNGNAAPAKGATASPHLTGAAVDITKRPLSAAQIDWMREYLGRIENAGKIDVEEEFQQSVFHISVYKSYAPTKSTPRSNRASAQLDSSATKFPN